MVRVLIVDDYVPWRSFVALALSIKTDVQIAGEAENGLMAIQKAIELQPDLVVLDVGLPDLNGIEVARQILEFVPRTKILFLTQDTSHDVVYAALRAGAHGYVVKSHAARDLLPALDALLLGDLFVSASIADPPFGDDPISH